MNKKIAFIDRIFIILSITFFIISIILLIINCFMDVIFELLFVFLFAFTVSQSRNLLRRNDICFDHRFAFYCQEVGRR